LIISVSKINLKFSCSQSVHFRQKFIGVGFGTDHKEGIYHIQKNLEYFSTWDKIQQNTRYFHTGNHTQMLIQTILRVVRDLEHYQQ